MAIEKLNDLTEECMANVKNLLKSNVFKKFF